jgi:hypothetical protein
MAYLIMLVIFHVNMITCQNKKFTTHLLQICWKKIFWDENFEINHMVSNMVQIIWNDMVQYIFNFH